MFAPALPLPTRFLGLTVTAERAMSLCPSLTFLPFQRLSHAGVNDLRGAQTAAVIGNEFFGHFPLAF